MANFAAIYPLPAGEQLLVVLITEHVLGPSVQYATEVHGNIVTVNVPLLEKNEVGDYLKRLSAIEEARQMIGNLDEETVKTIRRRFVQDLACGEETEFPKEEIVSCLPN